jgi:hypothetical protein
MSLCILGPTAPTDGFFQNRGGQPEFGPKVSWKNAMYFSLLFFLSIFSSLFFFLFFSFLFFSSSFLSMKKELGLIRVGGRTSALHDFTRRYVCLSFNLYVSSFYVFDFFLSVAPVRCISLT